MGDRAKIWETRSNMWESGFEPKGERDQFRREKDPEYFRQGQNTGDIAKQLFTVAKIWETHVKI